MRSDGAGDLPHEEVDKAQKDDPEQGEDEVRHQDPIGIGMSVFLA